MVKFDLDKIKGLEKIYRLNLINSCTGYKSANLIGSIDKEGNTNLAIFSSITHLGSDPAMICLLYTSPSPRDRTRSRMPSSA